MTQLQLYQVDSFTDTVFGGNPAAVCFMDAWLPDDVLQNIAIENNLSETAFFIPSKDTNADFDLRWFMPGGEVDLCGHATLATAFVAFEEMSFAKDLITFSSRSGLLTVEQTSEGLLMDLPLWNVEKAQPREDINAALGVSPKALYEGKYWLAEFDSQAEIEALEPDFRALKAISDVSFLIVSAPADDEETDFVSRFFCPQHGVDEDPVTGSAHCILTPFWAERLDKKTLNARQISKRGGQLLCEIKNDRVAITGQAVMYMRATIHI